MINRRYLLLLAALVVVIALTVNTSGVSMVATDRDVNVKIAEDQNAYIGLETFDQSLTTGTHEDVELIIIHNRLGRELTEIDVTISGDKNVSPKLQDYPKSLGVGESGTVTATINCGGEAFDTQTWSVRITASGNDVMITLDRTVSVSCENSAENDSD